MEIILIIISALLGSGLGSYVFQRTIDHRYNKRFFRYSKLYSDKLDIIKKLYSMFLKVEKALYELLGKNKPDKYDEMIKNIDDFNIFFEENELFFEVNIVEYIKYIQKHIEETKVKYNYALSIENSRGSIDWAKAIDEKNNLHQSLKSIIIPEFKEKLKSEFQKCYKLLE